MSNKRPETEHKEPCWILRNLHDRYYAGEDPDDFFPWNIPESLETWQKIEILSFGYMHLKNPDRRKTIMELLTKLSREVY